MATRNQLTLHLTHLSDGRANGEGNVIACLLGAVRVLQMSDDDELKMMGGNVLDIAHDYANAAACAESGDIK